MCWDRINWAYFSQGKYYSLVTLNNSFLSCYRKMIKNYLLQKCKEVYAIEMLEQHIADGVLTAQMNNITNFSFLHGRAEEQLGDLLKTLEGRNKEIVCILDPPKLGVNKRSTLTDLGKYNF